MDLTGNNVGNYKIIEKLGSGGMATVYKAHELSLNRMVAFKVLSSRLSEDAEYIKRFQREAQAAAKLNHPNIVQIYAIGEEKGIHYFAMEYIKGKSLADIAKEKNILPPAEAVAIMKPVAEALGEAHKAGLVHRDVKPSNIMIDASGRPKVTDFGIAYVSEAKTKLTQEGSIIGTPEYLSPEQCEGKTVDARSDIFSLGVTLYEILSGKTPYQADTPVSTLMKIIKGNFLPLNEVNPNVPDSVVKVVEKMMETDPQKRYANTGELIDALTQVEQSLTQPAVPSAGQEPPDRTIPEPVTASIESHYAEKKKRDILPAIAVAAIILLLLGGAFAAKVFYFDKKAEESNTAPAVETTAADPSTAQTTDSTETSDPAQPTEQSGTDTAGTADTAETTETIAAAEAGEAGKTPVAESTTGTTGIVETASVPGTQPASVSTPGRTAEKPAQTQTTGTPAVSGKPVPPRSASPKPRVVKRPLPPANSVIFTVIGDEDKSDTIAAYAQKIFSRDNFSIIDGPSVGSKALNEVARYHLVISAKLMETTTLNYYGNSTEQYTVGLTMKAIDTQTGKLVADPLTRTVKYTAINAEENLKEAVQELAFRLKKSLKN